jgi:hypothetical protein
MATATITARMTLINTMNGVSPGAINVGHANATSNEDALMIEGTGCAASGYSGNPPGSVTPAESECSSWASEAGVADFDGNGGHIGVWLRTLYPVFSKADGGVCILVMCSGTNQRLYFNIAGEPEYRGEWIYCVLDTNETTGTPDQTPFLTIGSPAMNGAGAIIGIGGGFFIRTSKGEDFLQNQYMDVAWRTDGSGDFGIQFSGGLTGDRLLVSDLVLADTPFYGVLQGTGVLFDVFAEVYFGGAALTTWVQDSGRTFVFADMPVAADLYKIIGQTGTLTNVDLQGCTWLGNASAPFLFDWSALAGSDAGNFNRNNFTDGGLIKLGPRTSADDATFTRCAEVQPFGRTINNPVLQNCDLVTLQTALDLIDGGNTALHNTATGVAFIDTDDPAKVKNHITDNTGGAGHFMEADTIGTYAIVGIQGWNPGGGYGGVAGSNLVAASGSLDAGFYNNSGGLITLNLSGGAETPSVRNGAGATTVVVLAVNYEITQLDAGAEVTIVDITTPATPVELLNEVAGIDGIVTYSFDGALTGTAIGVYIRNTTIENVEFDDVLPAADTSFPVPQPADTVYLP